MDLEEKLKNQTILIKQINEENIELKKANEKLSLDLILQAKDYQDTLEKAKNLMNEANKVISYYNELISKVKEYEEKYKTAYEDICLLKKKYKYITDDILEKIKT